MTDGGGRLAMRQRQRRNSGIYYNRRDYDDYPPIDPETARKDRIDEATTIVRNVAILAALACCLAAPILPAWLVVPSVVGIGSLMAANARHHFFGKKNKDADADEATAPVRADDTDGSSSKLDRSLSPSFNADGPSAAAPAIKPEMARNAPTLR